MVVAARGAGAMGGTTRGLAMHYVLTRHRAGFLNDRSAEVLRSALRRFAEGAPDAPRLIKRRHAERFVGARGLAASTRRGRLSALRGFARWLIVEKITDHDWTLGVEAPRVPQGLPRFLTGGEARQVVGACPDARSRLCVTLMLQEGLRRKEVADALRQDVDRARGAMIVRGKGFEGQGSRVLPVSDETLEAVDAYIAERPGTVGPLVVSHRHRFELVPLSPGRVGEIVTDVLVAAGVKAVAGDGKSPHALRHTMAQHMVDGGADVRQVQTALGHAHLKTTEVYLRGDVSDLRGAMGGRSYT